MLLMMKYELHRTCLKLLNMIKTILITGTSSGLGASIASEHIKLGWNVIGFSRGESPFKENNYTHYQVDIGNSRQLGQVFMQIRGVYIDVLVNNAAIFQMKSFSNSSLNEIDKLIDTNLKGAMYVTKFALSIMKEGSRIFFINSVAGLAELENQSLYCASKHGLTGFAGTLSKELQSRKIKVTSIHPGGINTPLWDNNTMHMDVTKLIDPKQITDLIKFICAGDTNIEYKTIKMFPDIEWHQ